VSKRTQFWMGFSLVALLLVSGAMYTLYAAGWEYGLQLLMGVALALFLSTLFVTGIAMMIDAKVGSK